MSEFRRVTHSTATFGDMSRATELPQPEGDADNDLISRAQQQQRQALKDREKLNEHRGRWQYLEYKRENIFAELEKMQAGMDELLVRERHDSQLREAGEQIEEILAQRVDKNNLKKRVLVEVLFTIKNES
jgi:membrane-anchored protein YejM (alkaline phosphatase superfamily)